ncbi:hypothetical protein [Litorihabitans aurantiacus]|uniref:Uncharacterized protein n=1 Tax=Litorihabitans aurantiacus TaxID=1930061 RepID=A0AA37UMK7_9MICO|nr:hypothetical protein [Litorihabitans aurantiacus]GMA30739.1 hypothetical protein GCM10025875_07310 [Litorihabitans aurantiacus]
MSQLGWRWANDAAPALDALGDCRVGDLDCPVAPEIRQALLDPLLLAAGAFSLAVGALVDARRRPALASLMIAGAIVLVTMVVTG